MMDLFAGQPAIVETFKKLLFATLQAIALPDDELVVNLDRISLWRF